jgi:hypothetical protein
MTLGISRRSSVVQINHFMNRKDLNMLRLGLSSRAYMYNVFKYQMTECFTGISGVEPP